MKTMELGTRREARELDDRCFLIACAWRVMMMGGHLLMMPVVVVVVVMTTRMPTMLMVVLNLATANIAETYCWFLAVEGS